MPRRDSAIMEIEPEKVETEEVDFEIEQDAILEQQELEDFEGTDVNESEYFERL